MLNKVSNFSGPISVTFKKTTTSVVVGGDSIRSSLSSGSQARYDSATVGDFVTVSSAEYASVVTSVTATKYIMNDTDLTSNFSGWSTGYNISYNDTLKSEATIATSSYIIGYAFSGGFTTGNITTYLRTGTSSTGTHTKIGSNLVFAPGSGNKTLYFIRKAPTTATSTKTYVSFYMNGNSLGQVSGKTNYPINYSQFVDSNSWTAFTGGYPTLQVIATTNKLW
jgi:hypothetical protein